MMRRSDQTLAVAPRAGSSRPASGGTYTRRLGWMAGCLLLGALAAGAAHAQPAEAPPGTRILTADDIEQAGVARLSDLFRLLDDWYGVSVEGFAWDVSANALAPLQEPSWLLLVDHQPVDLRMLDAQNVNLLPISPAEIAYVEVVNAPTMVSGVFAQAGVLHLHTRTPAAGAALRGTFSARNEVGDPGPYRYTDFATPNIDRIGPTAQGAASFGGAGWHARVHGVADEHHATDERIRQRVLTLYRGEKAPRLLLAGGGLDLGATGRLGRHRLFAAATRFQDLRFFEPLGLEAPTDHYLYHVGLGGDFWPGQPAGLSYRLSYTVHDLDLRSNRDGLDFNWRQNAFRSHYEVRAGTDRVRGALGLSYDLIEGFTGVELGDPRLILPRAYGRVAFLADPRWQPELTAYVSRAKGQLGYGALATVRVFPAPAQALTLTGSVARQPYAERNRLWYWVTRGYNFFDVRGLDVALPTGFAASTTYTADLAWRLQPSDGFSLTLSAGYRRFDDLTLAAYAFGFDSLSTALPAATSVQGGVSGQATKAGAEVRFRLLPSLEQRLHYAYVRYPAGDDVFFVAWRNQPWHRFSYTARFTPLDRLSLYARLAYRSETLWPAYETAAAASGGRYQAQLPGYWLLDLSAQKRFWGDRLGLSLSLRNFLNEAYRTHPAGAVTNMVFQVRLQAYFHTRTRQED